MTFEASGHAAPDPLAHLLARQSVGIKHLTEPGPGDAELRRMADAALRAPDHAGLVPYRFAVVRGASRVRLGELFVQAARAAGKDEAGAALDAERAQRAPVTVAVIARHDPGHPQVPVHEQWAALGGALAYFLLAAHMMGYGGKMLSGGKVRDAAIQAAFCRPGEQLVGWVALGTPVGSPARRLARPRAVDVIGDWSGPPPP
jgi:nitroreductase